MSFCINPKRDVLAEIQLVAKEQIEKALQELAGTKLSQPKVVHQVRKRCKKLRGLLRLARPGFEKTYQHENAFLRDTARQLSALRDSQTMLETYDALLDHFKDQTNRAAFASIRRQLTADRKQLLSEELDVPVVLSATEKQIREILGRVGGWELKEASFKPLGKGIAKTYARAVEALERAHAEPTAEAFHEWRKRVKYHRYHCKLLRRLWPRVIKAREAEASRLGEILGNEHDLAVLREHLVGRRDDFGQTADLDAFLALLDSRRSRLQQRAFAIGGRRLFAERPDAFNERLQVYWDASSGSSHRP